MVRKQPPQWVHQDNSTISIKKDIEAKYFHNSAARKLNLFSKEKDCYVTTQSRPYGLPTEEEVRQSVLLNNFKSDGDIISWFVNNRDNKYGVPQEVQEIINKEYRQQEEKESVLEEYRQQAAQ